MAAHFRTIEPLRSLHIDPSCFSSSAGPGGDRGVLGLQLSSCLSYFPVFNWCRCPVLRWKRCLVQTGPYPPLIGVSLLQGLQLCQDTAASLHLCNGMPPCSLLALSSFVHSILPLSITILLLLLLLSGISDIFAQTLPQQTFFMPLVFSLSQLCFLESFGFSLVQTSGSCIAFTHRFVEKYLSWRFESSAHK